MPAKDSSEEEAADRTAGDDGLFNALATAADGGDGAGGFRGKAATGLGYIFRSDLTVNNAVAGKDESREERGEEEGGIVLLFLRREGEVRLQCLLRPPPRRRRFRLYDKVCTCTLL